MTPDRFQIGLLLLFTVRAVAADSALSIPSISGNLVIDGKADEPFWQGAHIVHLTSKEFGDPFPAGGEARIAVRGSYLCLSARIPEPERLVAHSTGRDPDWWSEDVVTWGIRVQDVAAGRHPTLFLTVNPLGGYRLQGLEGTVIKTRPDPVLVAAQPGKGEWTVEAAIPIKSFAPLGFIDVERVRAARPDAPELHWFWPAANERTTFRIGKLTADGPPEHRPWMPPVSPARPKLATQFDWIPHNAWSDEERNRIRPDRMLENALRARMSTIADEEKREWQKVDSVETWKAFRDKRIGALEKWIGPWPKRSSLRTVVTHRADYGEGFAIENMVFESRPHLLVSANLYLPAKPSGKRPAIVVVHAHHAPKTQSELQDLGMTWARAGAAVLIMDQLCAGERSQSQPWPRESYYGRYALGNQLLLTGESLMKWMVWDLMRGIDVLVERADIDSSRIILLGAVAGGGDPAAVAAALDRRVAGVIPFNFGEAGPEEHYTLGPRGYSSDTAYPGWGEWETTRCLPRSSIDQFFPWLICASVAPRPFLYSFEIGWPEGVEREPAWARYRKVFELYGASDHLDEVHGFGPFPGPGECTNVGALLRGRIYPILARWFNVPVPAGEYHNPLPDSKLTCLTAALAAERRPEAASAIAAEMARQALSHVKSGSGSVGALRSALQEKLGDIEPVARPSAQVLWEKAGTDAQVEALAVETAQGIKLPVFILKPMHRNSARSPVVVAIAEGGKAGFLANRSDELTTLLRSGVEICLPDLRGTGEVTGRNGRGPTAMGLAETELMLGETMLGGRVKDVRTILRYLGSRQEVDSTRISLWGDSFAQTNPDDFAFDHSDMQEPGPSSQSQAEPMGALVALIAGLFEESVSAVAAKGGLVSFWSVLEDRFSHVPQDVIVPGVLEAGDLPDIVAALRGRPILLEGLVDGRNRTVRASRLHTEFAAALKMSSHLVVREPAGGPDLAAWLVNHTER